MSRFLWKDNTGEAMDKGKISQNLMEIANIIRNQYIADVPFEKMVEYLECLGYAEVLIRNELEKKQEEKEL